MINIGFLLGAFFISGFYHGGGQFNSQLGVSPKSAGILVVSFLIFVIYMIFRVRKSIKKGD